MAERISKIIDLDICGIDIMTTDISKPLSETDGAVLEVNDTPGLGDKIENDSFLDQFKGISFDNQNASIDAVSGATISSGSVAKAVRIAFEELNK